MSQSYRAQSSLSKSHKNPYLSAGTEATLQGLTTTVAPLLMLMSFFGAQSVAAGFWAILVTALVVTSTFYLFRGPHALIAGARVASVTAYIGLLLSLSVQLGYSGQLGADLSLAQLKTLFAAASLLFLLASLLVLLCGVLRLGNLFKLIPMPVSAGISNATAVLMLLLGVQQVLASVWLTALTALGMLICYLFWTGLKGRKHRLGVLPASVVAIVLGLGLAVLLEPTAAPDQWWMAPDPQWVSLMLWLELDAPGQPKLLPLLMNSLPTTLTLALVMILDTFTTASIMQARFGVLNQPNRTLIAVGGSNLLSAALGGLPCTPHLTRSVACWSAGGRGLAAAVSALLITSGLIACLGATFMVLPAGLVAGLFLIQAWAMADKPSTARLWELLRRPTFKRHGSSDMGFWTTCIITVAGAVGSMVWACFLGISLSCLLVLRRLSGNMVAQWHYLNRYRSRRVRSLEELNRLDDETHQVGILRLTGHLFFGNSNRILQLADELKAGGDSVVVDVNRIIDVDPTGIAALQSLLHTLTQRGLAVVLTGLNYSPSSELKNALSGLPKVTYRQDMDRGLEFCEDRLLHTSLLGKPATDQVALTHNALLQDLSATEIEAVVALADPRTVNPGQYLFRKDSASDGIWLIQQGRVSILAGPQDNARLTTCGPGQFMGELSLIDGKPRSASAMAETAVQALVLSALAIDTLAVSQPYAVQKILRNLARELSFRLRVNSSLLTNETEETNPVWSNSTLSPHSRF